MRVLLLACALLCAAPIVFAQDVPSSSPAGGASAEKDDGNADLPVSLDHIREGLKKAPEHSLLRNVNLPADFRMEIIEQQRINDMLSKIDFKSGPAPPGGLYGFEQQQRLFRPTDRPLMQPYAAFNGGELITIALENLIIKYLGGRALDAVTSAERSRAERAAREEVDQTIAAYCASRPDRANLELCTNATRER